MERSPLISWVFHLRAVSLLLILGAMDYIFILSAWRSVGIKGLSVEIVFGLEVKMEYHTIAYIVHIHVVLVMYA